MAEQPNVLFVMCDQLRFDMIAALGNDGIYTPNMDRLVRRGASFTRAYSSCPVCVPARYTVRTGCDPTHTGWFANGGWLFAEAGNPTSHYTGAYLPETMRQLGYRTFGVGKSHTRPWDESIGFETHLHSEELYKDPDQRQRDDYAAFIAREHPQFDFIEGLMGERTEMYYMPQMSPMPAEITVEAWAADRTVECLNVDDARPYFGMVSFVGPHPPCAPPLPFNRMYNPDAMPNPVKGDLLTDYMDDYLPWMNYVIWADDINDFQARALKARYYGEVSYIDQCLGKILDAVEARDDADNTVICFFSDHGDHLGDHHAWQKESFFEPSCRVPFLVSWPKGNIPADTRCDELVKLTDLFGIATTAAGTQELRDGCDVLGILNGTAAPRETLFGYYGAPGTSLFKVMVRQGDWKYIYIANGAREQLFNLADDPSEVAQRLHDAPDVAAALKKLAEAKLPGTCAEGALENGRLKTFPFEKAKRFRIKQFDVSRGITDFPDHPEHTRASESIQVGSATRCRPYCRQCRGRPLCPHFAR